MRWTRRPLLLAASATLLILATRALPEAEAREQHGRTHEHSRWGYKVKAPKNWTRRTIRLDEPWIADKFFPDYELRGRADTGEFVFHKPDLWVIGFPHARADEAVTREQVDENTVFITIRNPYKDYPDFVKRESWASTGGGGWFYSREDEIEHAGYKVSVYEIRVEKLVRAPMRVLTWVYHCEDVDFAVQVRILEAHYEENKAVIEGCLKSFKEIPRTEPFPSTGDAPRPTLPTEETEARTPDEIYAERLLRIEERIAREKANLPRGWRFQKSKRFVCITQVDKRYTGYVLNFSESLRKYLDEHFEDLGPAKLPPGLIRVFASAEEERAYQQGTRSWWADEVGEITMTIGRDASILSEFSWLAGRLTDQYFHVKNENLRWGMPGWIRHGIWQHIAWARPSKRSKMILAPNAHTIRELARLAQSDELMSLQELMTTATSDYSSYGHMAQAASVVHWLLHRGDRGKVKGAVVTYLTSLETIVREEDERWEAEEEVRSREEAADRRAAGAEEAEKTEAELEAEEEERFRERRKRRNTFVDRMKSKYDAIRARAFEAAFGHLTDSDWEKIDRSWRKACLP